MKLEARRLLICIASKKPAHEDLKLYLACYFYYAPIKT